VSGWKSDAVLAGQLDRGHKVYLSLLIARCVQPRSGQGRRNLSENSEKSSAKGFADHAGMSDKTVTAYLKTWDAMAKDGIVPPRVELSPGVDVDLPDQAKWSGYYREVNPKPKEEQDGQKDRPEMFPCEEARLLHGMRSSMSKTAREMSDQGRQQFIQTLWDVLEELEPAGKPAAKPVLDWNPGDWDDDKINESPRLVDMATNMETTMHELDKRRGDEGAMLQLVGKTVIDLVGADNKVLAMARVMKAVTDFAASYSVSHIGTP
jgi:hypothetical protein